MKSMKSEGRAGGDVQYRDYADSDSTSYRCISRLAYGSVALRPGIPVTQRGVSGSVTLGLWDRRGGAAGENRNRCAHAHERAGKDSRHRERRKKHAGRSRVAEQTQQRRPELFRAERRARDHCAVLQVLSTLLLVHAVEAYKSSAAPAGDGHSPSGEDDEAESLAGAECAESVRCGVSSSAIDALLLFVG